MTARKRRGSFLLLVDFERLEAWAKDVAELFDGDVPYLVGSVNERPDFRDVDLRLILQDETFDAQFGDRPVKVRVLNHAISTWGQRETGLPIDFQVQRSTEANAQFSGQVRNPMGLRDWSKLPTSGAPA